ncbi:hypothetical protein JCM6882_009028 [Rhodosporidiobolus microsporus]
MDAEPAYPPPSANTMDSGAFPSAAGHYPTLPSGDSYSFTSTAAGQPIYIDTSRLSPRSRAHSIASSVSSVASAASSSYFGETPETSAGARPSLDFPPATLQPGCDGEGFRVNIAEAGQWSVSWEELMRLLLNRETTTQLPQDHPISQVSAVLSARLQHDPYYSATLTRPSTGVSLVNGGLHHLGLQEMPLASDDQPFLYQHPSAHEPPLGGNGGAYYPPISPPSSRRRAAPEPIQTAATFVTPLQQAFVPAPGAAAAAAIGEDSAVTPGVPQYAQGTAQVVYAVQPVLPDQLPPLPPPPPSVFADASQSPASFLTSFDPSTSSLQTLPVPPQSLQQETLSLRPPSLAATRHLRTSTSPYARRPPHVRHASQASVSSTASSAAGGQDYGSLSNRSSSVDLSSADWGGGAGEGGEEYLPSMTVSSASANPTAPGKGKKPARRTLRPLNRDLEMYLWSAKKAQLSRVSAGMTAEEALQGARREEEAEVLAFPPGSYYKVVEDDLEILPCDGKNRVNSWLRGQSCVEMCSFRFEGKRPSVIRQHVVNCKVRANRLAGSHDPLKRLCQLQLDAQTMEAKLRHVRAASSVDRSAFFPDGRPLPPDPPPSATFASAGADDDASDRRSIASYDSQQSAGSSSFFPGSTGQSAASEELYWQHHSAGGSPHSQGESPHSTGYTPSEAWLAGYGLSVPTGSSAAAAGPTSSSSSTSGHFLQPASDGEKMLVSPVSQSFLTMDE